MSHRNVETLLGRFATDPMFRRRFLEDPVRMLAELCEQGVELTSVERDALASTDADAVRTFANGIDRRIRRADTQPPRQ